MLEKLKAALDRLKQTPANEDQVIAFLTKLVHSRVVGWLVALTGTKVDDSVLKALKEAFPK